MTRALTACSYRPITKASSDMERLARAVPGDTLYEFMEKLTEQASLLGPMEEGENIEVMVRDDMRGGLKISLASSSWLIPRRPAARWTAAGFLNLS